VVSASYLGNKTTHLWSGNGEINPATYIPGVSTTSNTNQRRLLYLANPTLGAAYASINTMDDGAVARYQAMLLSVRRSFGHGFTWFSNYTDSYCVGDTDFGAALATPANGAPFSRHFDWGPCNFDTRHNFNTSVVATSGVRGNGWAGRLLSNWQIAPLFHVSSGQPITVNMGGRDTSLTGLGQDRPIQVLPDVYASSHNCFSGVGQPCYQWINSAAFVSNPTGGFGTIGRDAVRGPGNVSFDVAVSRRFKITERWDLEARAESFNAVNHPNFVGAISPSGGSSFTTMNNNWTSSNFGRAQAAFDPRIMQFALKLRF
jgi:hypothetical protein